jgi:hypothetical protein
MNHIIESGTAYRISYKLRHLPVRLLQLLPETHAEHAHRNQQRILPPWLASAPSRTRRRTRPRTKPGKHQVVWRVEGLDASHAESLLRALASQYGGDPAATDISRLLRLPGFTNRKYSEAFVVRVHHETDAIYQGQDFHVQEDSPESPRHLSDSQQGSRKIQAGHCSQSRPIGYTQNGHSRVAIIPIRLSGTSPTTARKTKPTQSTMRD